MMTPAQRSHSATLARSTWQARYASLYHIQTVSYYLLLHQTKVISKSNHVMLACFKPKWYAFCLFYTDMFQIRQLSSMFIQVKAVQGLQLQYNWKEFRLYLQIGEQWREDTVGLCGTFNGNIQDDFLWVICIFRTTHVLHLQLSLCKSQITYYLCPSTFCLFFHCNLYRKWRLVNFIWNIYPSAFLANVTL